MATLRLAVAEAGKRAKKDFTDALLGLLAHQELLVRVETLKALARPAFMHDPQVLEETIKVLDDTDPIARGFAAKAVVIAGSDAGMDLLDRPGVHGAVLLLDSGDVVALPRTEEWLA